MYNLRPMKDLGLTMEFLQKGGTEFACLSTSASQEIAVNFAVSALPLIFKFETKDFTSRGADISFLSVRNRLPAPLRMLMLFVCSPLAASVLRRCFLGRRRRCTRR